MESEQKANKNRTKANKMRTVTQRVQHASVTIDGQLSQLRGREIAAEIYPEAGKMKKQMEYANRRGIPYVVIVGSQELEAGAATVKDMRTGEQRQVLLDKLATEICNS